MANPATREDVLQALVMVSQDIPEDSIRPQARASQATLTLPVVSIQGKGDQVILPVSTRVQDRVIPEVTTQEQEAIQEETTQEEGAIQEATTPALEATQEATTPAPEAIQEVSTQESIQVAIPRASTTLKLPRNPVVFSDNFLALPVAASAEVNARVTCMRQRTPSMVECRWPQCTALREV